MSCSTSSIGSSAFAAGSSAAAATSACTVTQSASQSQEQTAIVTIQQCIRDDNGGTTKLTSGLLAARDKVTTLDLSHCSLNLKKLQDIFPLFKNITQLNLSSCSLTGEEFASLRHVMKNVKILNLTDNRITAAGLKCLMSFKQFTQLILPENKVAQLPEPLELLDFLISRELPRMEKRCKGLLDGLSLWIEKNWFNILQGAREWVPAKKQTDSHIAEMHTFYTEYCKDDADFAVNEKALLKFIDRVQQPISYYTSSSLEESNKKQESVTEEAQELECQYTIIDYAMCNIMTHFKKQITALIQKKHNTSMKDLVRENDQEAMEIIKAMKRWLSNSIESSAHCFLTVFRNALQEHAIVL